MVVWWSVLRCGWAQVMRRSCGAPCAAVAAVMLLLTCGGEWVVITAAAATPRLPAFRHRRWRDGVPPQPQRRPHRHCLGYTHSLVELGLLESEHILHLVACLLLLAA